MATSAIIHVDLSRENGKSGENYTAVARHVMGDFESTFWVLITARSPPLKSTWILYHRPSPRSEKNPDLIMLAFVGLGKGWYTPYTIPTPSCTQAGAETNYTATCGSLAISTSDQQVHEGLGPVLPVGLPQRRSHYTGITRQSHPTRKSRVGLQGCSTNPCSRLGHHVRVPSLYPVGYWLLRPPDWYWASSHRPMQDQCVGSRPSIARRYSTILEFVYRLLCNDSRQNPLLDPASSCDSTCDLAQAGVTQAMQLKAVKSTT